MPPSTPDEVENVLFVCTDQQRVDSLGCYGNESVRTPNVDGIAERGARFDRAYTPAAICGPARAAMVSGVRPHRNGVLRNVEEAAGAPLSERFPCYPQLLRDAGYEAGLAGKWHVGEEPAAFGLDGEHYPGWHQPLTHPDYEAYLAANDLPSFDGDAVEDTFPEGQDLQSGGVDPRPVEASFPYFVAERAIEQLESSADADGPFYQSVHFFGPHNPYYLPREYFELYDPADVELPESAVKETFQGKPAAHLAQRHFSGLEDVRVADWYRYVATYWGFVSLIDDQVGRLLSALDRLGVREETAVVFTSDHGAFLTAHKLHDKGPAMYEDIYNVPFLAEGLGVEGAREEFVSLLDLAPTFCDLAGVEVPEVYDGRSLLDLPADDWRADVTAEFHGHFFPIEQRMLRTDRYKLVYNERDRWELYDLEADPHELENRIDDPRYGDVAARLYERLAERLAARGDDVLDDDQRKLTAVTDVWDP
jgi:arylsulfatase A-like enzyme